MTTKTKRDLRADLVLCEAATPGNWYSGKIGAEPMTVWYNVIGGPELCGIADDIGVRENAQFIAEARTGWPHAIERALIAERWLLALVEALERRDIAQTRMSSGTDYVIYCARKAVGR